MNDRTAEHFWREAVAKVRPVAFTTLDRWLLRFTALGVILTLCFGAATFFILSR